MPQSKINIESKDYLLYILNLEDTIAQPTINEKNIVPDPTNFTKTISNIISGRNQKRRISITGYTDNTTRLIFKGAYKMGTKIYPTLYSPFDSNNLTPSMFYYITKFNTSYKKGSDTIYYDMEIIEGGDI
jgi:hypothetical protein